MGATNKRPRRRVPGPPKSGRPPRKGRGCDPDPVRVEVQGCAARDLATLMGQAIREAGPRGSLLVIIVIAIIHALIALVNLLRNQHG